MSLKDLKEFTKQYETNRAVVMVINWLDKATQEEYNDAQSEMIYLQHRHEKNEEDQRWERILTNGYLKYLTGGSGDVFGRQ